MSDQLLPPRFLFRFSVPCRRCEKIWVRGKGVQLTPKFRLPHLAELDDAPVLADVRVGWNDGGLAFCVRVEGKRQTPWCRSTQLEESDGLHVWIDTRDMHNIHRATRFCHRFAFLPAGDGPRRDEPVAGQLVINRARENARAAPEGLLQVRSERRIDGYLLEACIPGDALTGFDPQEHPRLGFTYALVDRERGNQTFGAGDEFRYHEDPSVWGTLELGD